MIRIFKHRGIKKLPYSDRFITRLPSSTIGCGMLHEGNIYLMDYAIKNMPPADYILEIGSWAGLSTSLLLHLLKKYERREQFLGCDPWIYGYDETENEQDFSIEGRSDISRADYMAYIRQGFIQAMNLFHASRLPHTFPLSSDDFFERFNRGMDMTDVFGRSSTPAGRLSFAYIDGNHAYDFVKRDVENVSEHLVLNGMILLDDSYQGAKFGSALIMKELKKNPAFKVIGKNPNYLLQKIR